jgi:isocitrate dehydrogenase (NAD+)
VIIRENHEDLYAGIEFERGSDGALKLEEFLAGMGHTVRDDAGISIKPISVHGTQRIVRSAFEYAKANGRSKVTAAHKANIMKFSDGLFLEVARHVAADEYPHVEFEDRIIDNLCNQLVSRPQEYDVIVLPNLYGDIVSDLGAGMIGGLGMAPGGNIGDACAVFEATHGSAPKYKGQNKVNPSAMLLSGVMMLRHLGEREIAEHMEEAIADVIAEGESVTYDLKPTRDDPTAVGTSDMADAVIERMGAG